MSPRTPEDIIQALYDPVLKALRTLSVIGGAREHREQTAVATAYVEGTNSIVFTKPKRKVHIFCRDAPMFWVDSAQSPADAQSKLTTPNQRGALEAGTGVSFIFLEGITRLDFLAVGSAGMVFVTGFE